MIKQLDIEAASPYLANILSFIAVVPTVAKRVSSKRIESSAKKRFSIREVFFLSAII